eukprot:5862088-Pleurochrysis_carterae.AAC.1
MRAEALGMTAAMDFGRGDRCQVACGVTASRCVNSCASWRVSKRHEAIASACCARKPSSAHCLAYASSNPTANWAIPHQEFHTIRVRLAARLARQHQTQTEISVVSGARVRATLDASPCDREK